MGMVEEHQSNHKGKPKNSPMPRPSWQKSSLQLKNCEAKLKQNIIKVKLNLRVMGKWKFLYIIYSGVGILSGKQIYILEYGRVEYRVDAGGRGAFAI